MRSSRWLVVVLACLWLGCAARMDRPAQVPESRAPARDRATTPEENLVAFARLYGYVRFFHPTDAAEDADWQRLAVVGVQQVHDAPTLDVLAQRLEALFRPLAPSLQLWVDGEAPPTAPSVPRRSEGLVYWQYQGFPGSPVSLHRPPYTKVRVQPEERWRRRFSESPDPDARVETELTQALHVRLPVVLTAEQARRAPEAPALALPEGLDPSRDHQALVVRRAAVIEVWNVLRHFYPYQQELEPDWHGMLLTALHDTIDDRSVDDVRDTLRGLLEPLQDGHGYVGHERAGSGATLPVRLELVEGKPVVTGTDDPTRFAVGDVVEQIDGEPALERIRRIEARLSGTPQWRGFRAAAWEASRAALGQEMELVVERDGRRLRVRAETSRDPLPQSPRPSALHTFDDGVMYVDLTRARWSEIEPQLPALAEAPGVIFDLRGYPKDNDAILDHLLRKPEDSLWMHVPRFVEPDGEVAGWHDLGWHRRPAAPHIGGSVSFLISAEAISYAESVLGYVEAHRLGTLVGSPTAGANGDIVRVDTLAGFFVVYSGMRVTRHDGERFQCDGVRPHVEVHPTIAGLRAGRDEVLETGLEIVRGGKRGHPVTVTAYRESRPGSDRTP